MVAWSVNVECFFIKKWVILPLGFTNNKEKEDAESHDSYFLKGHGIFFS